MRGRLALACVVMLMGMLLIGGVALAKTFTGTNGSDDITGTKREDTIRGREGNDRLAGRGGPDDIHGGEGRDRLFGGNGDDTLRANDDQQDKVDCGRGRDFVYADRSDIVNFGCETVRRPL